MASEEGRTIRNVTAGVLIISDPRIVLGPKNGDLGRAWVSQKKLEWPAMMRAVSMGFAEIDEHDETLSLDSREKQNDMIWRAIKEAVVKPTKKEK